MYGHTYSKRMEQPGKFANPARGQLNKESEYFSTLVRASELGLARRVRQSRPASACSFSTLRLNMVLTYRIPLAFRDGAHLFILTACTPSDQPRVYRATQKMRTDGIHCRESAGTGSVVLNVVPGTGAALAGHHGPINMRLSFPPPLYSSCIA